jgi:hypothetical protein
MTGKDASILLTSAISCPYRSQVILPGQPNTTHQCYSFLASLNHCSTCYVCYHNILESTVDVYVITISWNLQLMYAEASNRNHSLFIFGAAIHEFRIPIPPRSCYVQAYLDTASRESWHPKFPSRLDLIHPTDQ